MEPFVVDVEHEFPQAVFAAARVERAVVVSASGREYQVDVLQTENGNMYEFIRVLKRAIFGEVFHAAKLENVNGRLRRLELSVAIKAYNIRKIRDRIRDRIAEDPMKEIAAYQWLGPHPNVMPLIESCHDSNFVYAVFPFCNGGELYEVVERRAGVPEPEARHLFRQIVLGVRHIHSVGVSHRDLSLENSLLHVEGELQNCVVMDFGMCSKLPGNTGGPFPKLLRPGIRGKKNYIAPEVISAEHDQVNSVAVDLLRADIWSLGVILFILITGVPPVDVAMRSDRRFIFIAEGGFENLVLNTWRLAISRPALNLVLSMLKPDPAQRICLERILAHEWMQVEGNTVT